MKKRHALAFTFLFSAFVTVNVGNCESFLLAIPKSINFVPSDPVLLFAGSSAGNLTTLPQIPGNPSTSLNDPINAAFRSSGELFPAIFGIPIPEPEAISLLLIGCGIAVCLRSRILRLILSFRYPPAVSPHDR